MTMATSGMEGSSHTTVLNVPLECYPVHPACFLETGRLLENAGKRGAMLSVSQPDQNLGSFSPFFSSVSSAQEAKVSHHHSQKSQLVKVRN